MHGREMNQVVFHPRALLSVRCVVLTLLLPPVRVVCWQQGRRPGWNCHDVHGRTDQSTNPNPRPT
jgi:hypothetical protein